MPLLPLCLMLHAAMLFCRDAMILRHAIRYYVIFFIGFSMLSRFFADFPSMPLMLFHARCHYTMPFSLSFITLLRRR